MKITAHYQELQQALRPSTQHLRFVVKFRLSTSISNRFCFAQNFLHPASQPTQSSPLEVPSFGTLGAGSSLVLSFFFIGGPLVVFSTCWFLFFGQSRLTGRSSGPDCVGPLNFFRWAFWSIRIAQPFVSLRSLTWGSAFNRVYTCSSPSPASR